MAKNGFFTEAQLDRCNLKTLANELPYGYNGDMLLAGLVYSANKGISDYGLSSEEAKDKVVDWYCTTPVEPITEWLDGLQDIPDYIDHLRFISWMHEDPALVAEAIQAVQDGWEA